MDAMYTCGEYFYSNPTWHEEDAGWKADQIGRFIDDHALAPATLCEVGCGTGEILLRLARRFPQATLCGYDISPQAAALWSTKEWQGVTFTLGDVSDGPMSSYDLMLIIDVVEHVEDYFGFLKKLKPLSSFKIFHIPLDLSVQSVMRSSPITKLRQTVGHIHYFYKDLALSSLKDCGYEVIDYRYTPSRLELPNQAWTSRVMKHPRRLLFQVHADLTVRILGGYSLLVLAR